MTTTEYNVEQHGETKGVFYRKPLLWKSLLCNMHVLLLTYLA